ncbi:MFS transporter [Cupriavidus sp. 2TAF22]|uniref:MFS transporter n=1 Tax=unclassified Cupriavidus TaxID=2640874 RepID=UPI003F8F61EE
MSGGTGSRAALLTASGACALIVLDTNIVAVTLPRIAADLHATFSDIEWVVSAYMLTFAGGLLPAGSLADKFGRKRMLLVGLAVFMLASLGCGLAATSLQLNLARAAKGVGAALLLTSALATIAHAFHDERERARAWAFWGACMGMATLVAPGLGGIISQTMGWRWVFLLNLPVGLLLGAMVIRHVENSRDAGAARIDASGALTFSGSLFLMIWALIEANRIGWGDPHTLLRVAGGAALFALFIVTQRVQRRPMLDLSLFRNPRLIGALLAMAAYAGCAQVMMTLIPLYLQTGLGFSAIASGAAMLPFALTMLVFPRIGVRLSHRIDASTMLVTGLVLVGLGNLLSAWAATTMSYLPFALAMAVTGSGAGLLNGDTQKNIMACIPRERSGMASGISTTTRFSAIVLSFGLLAGLLAWHMQALFDAALRALAPGALPQDAAARVVARVAAGDLDGALAAFAPPLRDTLAPLARGAFAGGFSWVLCVAAAAALTSAVLVRLLMRDNTVRQPAREKVAAEVASDAG